jgi:signal transduction histidine kinase
MALQLKGGTQQLARGIVKTRASTSFWLCAGALLLTPALGVLDYASGAEVSFSIFYLGPVALAAWRCGLRFSVFICILAAVCWYSADQAAGAVYSNQLIPAWNAFMRFCIFLLTAVLLSRVRRSSEELQSILDERTADLRTQIEHSKLLEQRIAQLGIEERARIGRDLHDDLGQFLSGLALLAKSMAQDTQSCSCHGKPDLERLVELLGRAARKTRQIDRMLRPTALETGGLAGGLNALAQEARELFGIECSLKLPDTPVELDATRSLLLYRIAQEAISNAIRHGQAKGLTVELLSRPAMEDCAAGNSTGQQAATSRSVLLVVEDKGKGFFPELGVDQGIGLEIMRHRAQLMNAELHISSALGHGCRVKCIVPMADNVDHPFRKPA